MNTIATNKVSPFMYYLFIEVNVTFPKTIPKPTDIPYLNSSQSVKDTFKIYETLWTLDRYEAMMSKFSMFNGIRMPELMTNRFIPKEKSLDEYLKYLKKRRLPVISRHNFGSISEQIYDYLFQFWITITTSSNKVESLRLVLPIFMILLYLLWMREGNGMTFEEFIKWLFNLFKTIQENAKAFYNKVLELLNRLQIACQQLIKTLKDFLEEFGYLYIWSGLSLLLFLGFFIKFLFKLLGKLRDASSVIPFSFHSAKLAAKIKKILGLSNLKVYLKYLLRILKKFKKQIDQIEEKKSRHYLNLKDQLNVFEKVIYELAELIQTQENIESVIIEPNATGDIL
jgi:hypothetical protein